MRPKSRSSVTDRFRRSIIIGASMRISSWRHQWTAPATGGALRSSGGLSYNGQGVQGCVSNGTAGVEGCVCNGTAIVKGCVCNGTAGLDGRSATGQQDVGCSFKTYVTGFKQAIFMINDAFTKKEEVNLVSLIESLNLIQVLLVPVEDLCKLLSNYHTQSHPLLHWHESTTKDSMWGCVEFLAKSDLY